LGTEFNPQGNFVDYFACAEEAQPVMLVVHDHTLYPLAYVSGVSVDLGKGCLAIHFPENPLWPTQIRFLGGNLAAASEFLKVKLRLLGDMESREVAERSVDVG
jgi:hypothetical protein